MNGQHTAIAANGSENFATCTFNGGPDEDASLVAAAKSGNGDAFGMLFERYRPRAYRIVFRMLHNNHDAEDAVQRCFQRAFTNLHRFREESSFSTWVTRIAINEALMMLRQRRTNIKSSPNDDDAGHSNSSLDVADERPSPEQEFAQAELRSLLHSGISRLRKSLRVVIDLREIQGLTSAETARRLGLTVTAVKARAFHARRHLRRHFERQSRHCALVNRLAMRKLTCP